MSQFDYPKTRAEFRDAVRRELSQVPPIDDGVGAAGVEPDRNPFPTNALCDNCTTEAVLFLSRKGKIAKDPVPQSISVAAQTADGPWYTSLSLIAPAYSVNDVLRVAWIADGGGEQLLISDNRENMDRTYKNYMTQAPGAPMRYWTEGGALVLWPAPVTAGTLSIMVGKRLWSQAQNLDGETVDLIPSEYQPLITKKATSLICATQPDDAILRDLKAGVDLEIADMLMDFMAWAMRQNRSMQARMVPRTGRSGMMLGRR